ncbi:MAG TPA: S1/P1 Nuclease [Thermoanaerobaculia bacterium]|jgi:hypothetical protein|nr:S1/P1 Nuclease [Thermoanaerobaculia bacterium]
MSRFVRNIDFSSLGLKDLLEARDVYHVHLANLEHVVGTAVGRYRIRRSDPDYENPLKPGATSDAGPRTLANSGVKPWSWPCVLVFVNQWESRERLGDKPAQMVPPRLYLPDGRVIPTCVVYAPRQLAGPPPLQNLTFPTGLIGGGFPILTDDQEQQRVGSIGCLVTDGYYTYALTSKHVVGSPGTPAYVIERGERRVVATAHTRAEEKVALEQAYPGFPGVRTLVNVDAGLLRLNALPDWTSQVYGIGPIGDLIDLGVDTLNLDLVGCPVRANGAASGQLRGEIQGLFYRYRAVGGFDYVAELLIGPRESEGSVETRPGDSGTVWFWDADAEPPLPDRRRPEKLEAEQTATAPHEPADVSEEPGARTAVPTLRPLGLQWGGHSFLEPGGQGTVQFALASSLSTVCRLLDVELLRDWSLGHSLYWGKVGHYKIAFTACLLASNPNLDQVLRANATRIAVSDQDIITGNLPAGGSTSFIALADVADLVWRNIRKRDEANHFADMDEPGGAAVGSKTLMELWNKPANRTPDKWTQFYDSLPTPPQDKHRGALPFRVRELYEAMVGFVTGGDLPSFVCAAGALAHYVGDACQPLHVSRLHHGRPGHPEESDVHSFFETRMLDRFAPELVTRINEKVKNLEVADGKLIQGGAAAANRVVRLMQDTIARLPPEVVVETWVETKGPNHTRDLWEALADETVDCMVDGALCLAELWQSAWIEGDGDQVFAGAALDTPVSKSKLKSLYNDIKFVESRWLKDMSFS